MNSQISSNETAVGVDHGSEKVILKAKEPVYLSLTNEGPDYVTLISFGSDMDTEPFSKATIAPRDSRIEQCAVAKVQGTGGSAKGGFPSRQVT